METKMFISNRATWNYILIDIFICSYFHDAKGAESAVSAEMRLTTFFPKFQAAEALSEPAPEICYKYVWM